jgi:hypothetical protein
MATDRDFLFGLLAWRTGLIQQAHLNLSGPHEVRSETR